MNESTIIGDGPRPRTVTITMQRDDLADPVLHVRYSVVIENAVEVSFGEMQIIAAEATGRALIDYAEMLKREFHR